MPLQPVEFPFISGADESIDSKVLPMPRVVRAENLRTDNAGMLRKCKGTAAIAAVAPSSPSPTPIGPVRLFNHNDQLCVCGEQSIWSYSPAEDQLEELDQATVVTLENRLSLGHYGARQVVARGAATITDFTVYAWVTSDDTDPAVATDYQLHVLTVDNTTGSGNAGTSVPVTSSSLGLTHLKVIPVNDAKVTILWGETQAGPSYVIRYMDVTSANAGPYTSAQGGLLVSGADITDDQWFDACPHGTGYVVAFFNGTTVTIHRYNASHASQANTTASFTGASPRVQVCGNFSNYGGATISLVILSTTNAFVRRYDDSLATVGTYNAAYSASVWDDTGVTGVAAIPYEHSSGSYDHTAMFVNVQLSNGMRFCKVYYSDDSDTLAAASGQIVDAYVIAKPWQYDDDLFLPILYYTEQANSHCAILRHDPAFGESRGIVYATPEIRVLAGQGSTFVPDDPSATIAVSGTSAKVIFPMVDRFSSPDLLGDPTGVASVVDDPDVLATGNQTISVIGCDGYEFRLAARDRFMVAKVGGTTYLGGGYVQAFDGRRLFEMGYWAYPDITNSSLTVSASGGGLEDGTYTYAHVWEWTDNLGNVHQSSPRITQVTINNDTGTSSVVIDQGYELSQTAKHWRLQGGDDRPITLVHYASEADGTLLYRLEGPSSTAFTENSIGFLTDSLGTYTDGYTRTAKYPEWLSTTASTNTAQTGHTVDYPTNLDDDDMMIVIFATTVTAATTHSTPSGFTLVGNGTTSNMRVSVFTKDTVASTDSGGSVNVVTSASIDSIAHVIRIKSNTHNDEVEAVFNTGAFVADNAAITASWGADRNLFVAATSWRESTGPITAAPDGYTNATLTDAGTYGLASSFLNSRNAIENPGAWTDSGIAEANEVTLVIRPKQLTGNASVIELTSRELLYATSFGAGQLPNEPPPPSRCIIAHDGRLWGINDEDPTQVWYSKLSFPGVGLAWNRTLVVQFEAPVKALASQDGNLIAFTAHGIYTVVGRGADNTGGNTTYEPPQLLSGERGTTNPRAVVASPAGLFFVSSRGIELLPRGGASPEFIGDAVGDTLASYPNVVDAYHDEASSEVLFSCLTAETVGASGRILAYDYHHRQWFVRTRASKPITSIAELSGSVVYGIYDSASALTLWQEDSGFDEADSSHIPWTIETGDIRLGGLMRDQRINDVFALGQAFGVETIRVRESVDSGATWTAYRTRNITAVANRMQLRYTTYRTKAPAHRFEISSAAYSATVDSEGVALNGLQIHGAPLRGRASLHAGMEI